MLFLKNVLHFHVCASPLLPTQPLPEEPHDHSLGHFNSLPPGSLDLGFSLRPFQFNHHTTRFLKFRSGVHVRSPQGSLNKYEPVRVALKALHLLFFPVEFFLLQPASPTAASWHFLPFSRAQFPPLECTFTHLLHALFSSSPLFNSPQEPSFYICFPPLKTLALSVLSWMLDLCLADSSFRAQVKVKCHPLPFVIRFDVCETS